MPPCTTSGFDTAAAAKAVVRAIQRHFPKSTEYREVDSSAYPHVSQRFYAQTTEALRAIGFRTLGDMEDKALSANAIFDPRSFMRVMVDAPGTTVAVFYQVAPVLKWRLAMLLFRFPATFLDFSSLDKKGSTYGTSNKPEKVALSKPDWATRQLVSRKTKPRDMYDRHRQMLQGVTAPLRPFRTLVDVIHVQTDVRARHRAYLQEIGYVTKDYLRLNRIPPAHVDAVYDEVQRLVREGQAATN